MTEVPQTPITYQDSGVNYALMDPFKIACQKAAITTAANIERFVEQGFRVREVTESRGGSAYQVELTPLWPNQTMTFRIAHVEEGLGTKNEISYQLRNLQAKLELAEEMQQVFGRSFYKGVASDNAAMILNDLATSGASPVSFLLRVGAFPSSWFADEERNADLIAGTLEACNLARCAWGGGESAALRDIINEGHAILSGSAWGLNLNWTAFRAAHLEEGDRIVLVGIDGPGANGITLLRGDVKDRLPKGYLTELSDGRTYAEAVLATTPIYSRLVDVLNDRRLGIKYASNITGHSWRKIMRANRDFTYAIDRVPEPPEIFKLVQDVSGMTNEQIYGDYNMGAGFALFVRPGSTGEVIRTTKELGYQVTHAGVVEKGPKRVVIGHPVNVVYEAESLQVR